MKNNYSDDEDIDNDDDFGETSKKANNGKKRKKIDEEEDGGEEGFEDSSEEEEDGPDQYVIDGFVVEGDEDEDTKNENGENEDDEGDEEGDEPNGSQEEDPEQAEKRREERRRRRLEKHLKKQGGKLRRLKKLKRAPEESTSNSLDDVLGEESDLEKGGDVEMDDYEKSNYRSDAKSRVFGVDDDDEEFELEASEEDDEDYSEMKPELAEKDKIAMIKQQYEPSILEEKHFTEADEEIRVKNAPERFKTRKGTRFTDDRSAVEEAEWIYETGFEERGQRKERVEAIASVLKLIQKDQMEVPYIHTYEKDVIQDLFNQKDLWKILDLDEKWAHLKNSKENLKKILDANQSQLEPYQEVLRECRTEEGVSDLYDLFQMISSLVKFNKDQNNNNNNNSDDLEKSQFDDYNDTPTMGELGTKKQQKKAIKRDLYTTYFRAGFAKFLTNYGMSARDFGMNLNDQYMTTPPRDPEDDTRTASRPYITHEVEDEEDILKAGRYMMSQEIAFDPLVRQYVRAFYKRNAQLSTLPTTKGYKEIDCFHPYYTVASIKDKPCSSFSGSTQFLLILKAEKDGFIKISIDLASITENDVNEMENLYLSNGTSSVAQQWNEQRRLIIKEALNRFLYPMLEKEMRNQLTSDATSVTSQLCCEKLDERIMVAPWQPHQEDEDDDDDDDEYNDDDSDNEDGGLKEKKRGGKKFKILSFVNGTDLTSTVCALVDRDGELLSHAKLEFLCDRMMGDILRDRKTKDIDTLSSIIRAHRPSMILISATDLQCRRLHDEINELINKLRDENLLKESIDINFMSPEIGNSLQQSSRMVEEFKDLSTPLRHAIVMARCFIDPLTEYSALCNDSNDILFLKLHPLQDMIGKDYLAKQLHRSFINVVNAVGVDINRMVRNRYCATPLQFISGLGSRKAQMIMNILSRKGGYLSSRSLYSKLLNQDVVTKNSSGFLQIKKKYLVNSQHKIDRLDETRIHPESYPIAYRIVVEASGKTVVPNTEDKLQNYVDKVMRHPNKLDKLDYDQFADTLEQQVGRPMRRTLAFIRTELTHPFKDIRRQWQPASPELVFNWLTGESDESLSPGTLLSATVARAMNDCVKVRLENGLEGNIDVSRISDDPEANTKGFSRGTTLNCRVLSVDRERFQINLTCKPSDLEVSKWESDMIYDIKSRDDNKYLLTGSDIPRPSEPKRKPQARAKVSKTKRIVHHVSWKSFSCLEAEKYLRDKPIGEFVFRPSSKGYDHITCTFKFWDDIILHHDIREADKPNAVSLGKSFYIGETKFESLEEIESRHIEYLISNLNEVRNHQHWMEGSKDDIDKYIKQEKINNPKSIPYKFGISHQYPGFVTLYHVPNSTPRHEQILIKDDGFQIRKKTCSSMPDLIKYFKQNYKELLSNKETPGLNTQSNNTQNNNKSNTPVQSNTTQQRLPSNPPSNSSGSGMNRPPPPMSSGGYNQPPSQPSNQYRPPYGSQPIPAMASSSQGGYNQGGYNQPPPQYRPPPQNYPPPQGGYNQGGSGYNQPPQYRPPPQNYPPPQGPYPQQGGYNQPPPNYPPPNQPPQMYNQPWINDNRGPQQGGYNQPPLNYPPPNQPYGRGPPNSQPLYGNQGHHY